MFWRGEKRKLKELEDRIAVLERNSHPPVTFVEDDFGYLRVSYPECYGSRPGRQQQAENDCDNCPHIKSCLP